MKVKFKPESDFVFPSYDADHVYEVYMGEYADYLLLIMRQVISERACLMLL